MIFGLIFVHVFACIGIWYWCYFGISRLALFLFWFLVFFSGFAITIFYHRGMTHRGFKCPQWLSFLSLIGGGMAAEGSIEEWGGTHRQHHGYTETIRDAHSPHVPYKGWRGLLWAHMLWPCFDHECPSFSDFKENNLIQWQKQWYGVIVLLGFLIPFFITGVYGFTQNSWKGFIYGGLGGLFAGGFVRMVVVWHITWLVNSVCHVFGSRMRDSQGNEYSADESRNCWWLALITLGEAWHCNHHADEEYPYHGRKWYQIDLSGLIIRGLAICGLMWDIKTPKTFYSFKKI
jgi:stearoyl-CoA desaturase (delta-9 desaturase)